MSSYQLLGNGCKKFVDCSRFSDSFLIEKLKQIRKEYINILDVFCIVKLF